MLKFEKNEINKNFRPFGKKAWKIHNKHLLYGSLYNETIFRFEKKSAVHAGCFPREDICSDRDIQTTHQPGALFPEPRVSNVALLEITHISTGHYKNRNGFEAHFLRGWLSKGTRAKHCQKKGNVEENEILSKIIIRKWKCHVEATQTLHSRTRAFQLRGYHR